MSNKQFGLYLLATVLAMGFFMAWFMPAVSTPSPEYVKWKEECLKDGKIFRDSGHNVYCVKGEMFLYGKE